MDRVPRRRRRRHGAHRRAIGRFSGVSALGIPGYGRAAMARAPHPLVLAAIALAGAALCAFSIHVATNEGVVRHPGRAAPVDQHPLHRRGPDRVVAPPGEPPRRPHGGVGFSTGLLCLQFVDNTPLWSIGAFLDIFAAAAFIHVTLAFPTGRLRSTRERVLVGAGYAIALGLQVAKLMFLGVVPQNGFAVSGRLRHLPDDRARPALQHLRHLPRGRGDAAGAVDRHRAARAHLADGAGRLLRPGPRGARRCSTSSPRPTGRASWRSSAPPSASSASRRSCSCIGVLDARLARSGVSDLVVQLRGNPDAAELQARAGPRAARPHAPARLLAPRVRQLRRRRRP